MWGEAGEETRRDLRRSRWRAAEKWAAASEWEADLDRVVGEGTWQEVVARATASVRGREVDQAVVMHR